VIADAGALGVDRLVPSIVEFAGIGVRWIQVRAKSLDDATLFRLAAEATREVAGTASQLWIDDRADIAAAVNAAGIHVGQSDLSPSAARRVVGDSGWVGLSTHNREQVDNADRDPDVDLIAVGPVFATSSKKDPDPTVGLDFVRWARSRTQKPVVAIGGIDAENLGQVLDAGAHSVAVLGAACRGDIRENGLRLLAAARRAEGARSPGETLE